MDKFRAGIWNRYSRYISFNKLGKTLTTLGLMAAALAASATSSLSRVSCGGNSYSAPATDACSVYLTTKSNTRTYVTLKSNNPAVTVPSGVTVKQEAITTGFKASVSGVTTAQTAIITAQAGGVAATFSITLSPPATGTAALSVNTNSIGFGSVEVDKAVAQPLTLSSTGTAPVTVTSANVSGTGFSVSGITLPLTLNPGQSLTVEVGFDPATAGTFGGQLSIASNAAANPVTLSGTGTAAYVDLSWTAPSSTSDPAVGYNVYRAPSGTQSFQRVNTSTDAQTAYTDNTVQSGSSYDYIVKSVDSSGTESTPSNTTTVAIP